MVENDYGDMIIASDEEGVLPAARMIVFEQAYRTIKEIGGELISFKMVESKGDMGCYSLDEDGFGGHLTYSDRPHWHVGWKARIRK